MFLDSCEIFALSSRQIVAVHCADNRETLSVAARVVLTGQRCTKRASDRWFSGARSCKYPVLAIPGSPPALRQRETPQERQRNGLTDRGRNGPSSASSG